MLDALSGLVAGSLHVVSGPDHMAALAPLAVSDRSKALRIGAMWGVGHGLGVVLLGGLGQLFRDAIDISLISATSERIVGVLLIGMGLWALWHARRPFDPEAEHGHDHSSMGTASMIGLLHGAAGGGHLFGVLPSLALPPAQAALYLLCYLFSAVLTMGTFGLLLGKMAKQGGATLVRAMMVGCGVVAIGVGIWWSVAASGHA